MVQKTLKISIIFIILISSNIYAQTPDTVWVDDDYISSTAGWGTTHFAVIQNGINAVAKDGTVNVAAGTWNENIEIQDGKSLIGAGVGQSFINGDNNSYTITVRGTDSVIKYFTVNNTGGTYNFEIHVENANNVTVDNNHTLNNGIQINDSDDCTISNNLIEGIGALFINSTKNSNIKNNVLNRAALWITQSFNNDISDNLIDCGVNHDAECTGIRSRGSHNNLYKNNTIQGFRVNIVLMQGNHNILTGNNISGHWDNPGANSGGIVVFRGDNNTIINNNIDDVKDGGVTLFGASSNNVIQSNSITNSERGIELYYDSNDNRVINNIVNDNSVGIILDNTSGNIVCDNNIANNQINGYDDGNNEWDFEGRGNYWSDYQGEDQNGDGVGDSTHFISSSGSDQFPTIQTIPITLATVPSLQITNYEVPNSSIVEITDEQTKSDTQSELSETYAVKNGGSLILDNVDWEIVDGLDETLITVESGGTLRITNSRIIAQGGHIQAQEGAILQIENSELVGLGNWDGGGGIQINCADAVIKDNVIIKSYAAIVIDGATGLQIINNRISEAFTGIRGADKSSENRIEGNNIYNMTTSAIFAGGLNNSTIINNTFRDMWGEAMILEQCGVDCISDQNIIHGNSFLNCGPSGQAGNYDWHHNNEGNYYSDYLDRYPDAQEHSGFSGIWNKPYVHNNTIFPDVGSYNDNYPLMYPVYLDTIVAAPEQPLLLSPSADVVNVPTETEFSWSPSVAASSYRLQISDDANFESPLFNQGGIAETEKVINNLNEFTVYYWRVLAENLGMISGWSAVQQFTTGEPTNVEESQVNNIPKSYALYQNYPNPFNPLTTIHFTIPKISNVKLKIYDILGREIDTILDKQMKSGEYHIIWEPKGTASGIYFYQLQAEKFIEIKKLILLK